MNTGSFRLGLGVLGLAVLVSCSTTSEGSPKPAPTNDTGIESTDPTPPDTDPGDDLPFAGAPKVDDPMDTTRFQQDPCLSLTEGQAQELSLTSPGEPDEGGLGNICTWPSTADRTARVTVAFLNKDPRGLSALYKANDDGKFVYFEELAPIEGFPAIARDGVEDRDIGKCKVVVGTSDEIAFELVLQLSQVNVGKKDPCETAAMVAGMTLRTMKGE
jgi:hypothetical protein